MDCAGRFFSSSFVRYVKIDFWEIFDFLVEFLIWSLIQIMFPAKSGRKLLGVIGLTKQPYDMNLIPANTNRPVTSN